MASDCGQHRAYITCLFGDLRGFTAFVETAAPEELFDVLRQYHTLLADLIPKHSGTLERFAGDGLPPTLNASTTTAHTSSAGGGLTPAAARTIVTRL